MQLWHEIKRAHRELWRDMKSILPYAIIIAVILTAAQYWITGKP